MDYQKNINLAHDMPGYECKWICSVCLLNAISGVLLEFQLQDTDNNLFIYFDSDQTPYGGLCVGSASTSFI